MNATSLESARAAREKLMASLDGLPELRGIGITRRENGYAVKVNVSSLPPSSPIPDCVDSVPVVVEVVGSIRAVEL